MKTHGMSKTRIYRTWRGMINRCKFPYEVSYKNYGARGIKVCERWLKFENFYEDMKDGYTDEMTIDRVDNNKGYYKENCKWSTPEEQQRNKRNVLLVEYEGETLTLPQLSEKTGVNYDTIRDRLHRGEPLERVVKPPRVENVSYDKARDKWKAYTKKENGKRKELGRYKTKEDALAALEKHYGKQS